MGFIAGFRVAHHELARKQKPGAGVPPYMRTINRKLGRILASAAAQGPFTPNHVTAASFVSFLGAAALLVLAEPSVLVAVAATVLLQLGFALDSADGQLARLRGGGGPAGEWTDHVVDAARHLLFHFAIGVGLYRFADVPDAVLLLPLAFALVTSVRFFAQILAEQLVRGAGPGAGDEEGASRYGTLIQSPSDTGLQNLLVLLWPWTVPFVIGYAVFLAANTVLLAATVVRKHRSLTALSRAGA